MLREDGSVTVYLIQHRYPAYHSGKWVQSSLDEFLFRGMDFRDRASEQASYYRNLISKTYECWQINGIDGFLNQGDAMAARDAVAARAASREPEREGQFRVVRRLIQQDTLVIK